MKTFAVILAAGEGRRFLEGSHSSLKKQYYVLDHEPMWVKAVRPFQYLDLISHIILVVPSEDVLQISKRVKEFGLSKILAVIAGGRYRQDSVYAALSWILERDHADFVFIHDGARPFVTADLIDRIWKERDEGAVIPVIPISDTVKRISSDAVIETLDRSGLVRVQTPELFSFHLIMEAFEWLKRNPIEVTDDASLVERLGKRVKVVEGDPNNIKITTLAEVILRAEGSKDLFVEASSVGQGIDVHPFMEGRKLILGGVEIPHEKGLKGHSDADVLTHAVCDALLGAAGFSDIGTHFPDHDVSYKNISSLMLLQNVVDKLRSNRYRIVHIDVTVMAERPKIAPFVHKMKEKLSVVLGVSQSQLAIKAKTGEGIGFIGREEGIVAMAVATVLRSGKGREL
jgi:2-C-methyl-D-erythritol 2,4-cyclodiphosphate synthase/2-C-methyl-D-erythritol 4-phosphate cytidylyltransferase